MHSPRLSKTHMLIGGFENAEQRCEVDVVVIKLIKDMQHHPSPTGEG